MRRREFIAGVGGAVAAWPLVARAQQSDAMRRIAVLHGLAESDRQAQSWFTLFRKTMQELGWDEQRNISIEYRWTAADPELARKFAADLVNLAPDVLFATNTVTLEALRRATSTIPIVFVQVSDPAGNGFVRSLARPGGNVTGFAHFDYEIGGKWLEVLRDAAPGLSHAGAIYGVENPASPKYLAAAQAAAGTLGVILTPKGMRDGADIERVIGEIAGVGNSGLIVQPSPLTIRQRKQIVALAEKHHLPAVYPFRFFAADGGLVSYGVHTAQQYREAATYIDRILRGERAGELPVQAPSKFELVVNLKTAKALGLTIPPLLLARADEVIE